MSKNTTRRRHIATIAAALELAERTERELDTEGPGDDRHGLLTTVAGDIVDDWIGCAERWSRTERAHEWTNAGIRAFVLAYAANAPDAELARAAEVAEMRRDWIAGYAIATRYSHHTGEELRVTDLEALARSARGEAAPSAVQLDDRRTDVQEVH